MWCRATALPDNMLSLPLQRACHELSGLARSLGAVELFAVGECAWNVAIGVQELIEATASKLGAVTTGTETAAFVIVDRVRSLRLWLPRQRWERGVGS